MRKFILAIYCLVCLCAHAQTAASRANILSEIDSNLPSGTGSLTAANLRLTLKDIAASSFMTLTDGSPGVAGNITGTSPIVVTGTWPNLVISYSGSGGSGTVTSVGLTAPSFLTVTGSPVTTSGTLALAYSGTPLPVLNGGTGTTTPGIVAGTNVTVTGTWPNQTINSTGGGGGSGTVTSVALTTPAWLTVSGSPVTTTGTLAVTATAAQTANQFLATPSGSAGAVGLRALTAADLPVHAQEILFGFDGGGSVIVTGTTTAPRPLAYACTITGWLIGASPSGSITVDVQKATPVSGVLTFSSITASAPITLTTANANSSNTLTGWTTTCAAGDYIRFVVSGSPVTATQVSGVLKITR